MAKLEFSFFGRKLTIQFNRISAMETVEDNSSLLKQILRDPVATDSLYSQLSGIAPREITVKGEKVVLISDPIMPVYDDTFFGRLKRNFGGD